MATRYPAVGRLLPVPAGERPREDICRCSRGWPVPNNRHFWTGWRPPSLATDGAQIPRDRACRRHGHHSRTDSTCRSRSDRLATSANTINGTSVCRPGSQGSALATCCGCGASSPSATFTYTATVHAVFRVFVMPLIIGHVFIILSAALRADLPSTRSRRSRGAVAHPPSSPRHTPATPTRKGPRSLDHEGLVRVTDRPQRAVFSRPRLRHRR